jgi:uncharacterized membrane protein HdeD (DUF308 family)
MERRSGGGWYDFAGAMFGIAGFFNSIQGLSAIVKKEYFSEGALVYEDLQLWGWIWLIVGVVQVIAALSLLAGRGRMLGIVLAALSAVVSFTSLGAYPLWSILVIAVDVLVIHGLTVGAAVERSSFGEGVPRPEMPPPALR